MSLQVKKFLSHHPHRYLQTVSNSSGSFSHLKADLDFILDSLLQKKGLLQNGFQVSCYKAKIGWGGHMELYLVHHHSWEQITNQCLIMRVVKLQRKYFRTHVWRLMTTNSSFLKVSFEFWSNRKSDLIIWGWGFIIWSSLYPLHLFEAHLFSLAASWASQGLLPLLQQFWGEHEPIGWGHIETCWQCSLLEAGEGRERDLRVGMSEIQLLCEVWRFPRSPGAADRPAGSSPSSSPLTVNRHFFWFQRWLLILHILPSRGVCSLLPSSGSPH